MPTPLVRRLTQANLEHVDPAQLLAREWLATNGLGGYASGTVPWIQTRRYHGLLTAALPPPLGRMMMFNEIAEELRLADGRVIRLSKSDVLASADPSHTATLREFRLEMGLPVWEYEFEGYTLERRLMMPYRSNTVHITYRLLGGAPNAWVRLRPYLHFRPHESAVSAPLTAPYMVASLGDRFEVTSQEAPPLRFLLHGPARALVLDGGRFHELFYLLEHQRGYDDRGTLWSPGYFRANLPIDEPVTMVASTEPWEIVAAFEPAKALEAELQRRQHLLDQADPRAKDDFGAELVLAADQFIITPTHRVADAARAHAAGDEVRSVIAGYHWFTDWGRDTMISLPGLALVTGRHAEAGYILRTFAHYVHEGLIPNLFPEGARAAVYHTADASLWYFRAVHHYLEATNDRNTLRTLLPVLRDIIEHHLGGTLFGIHVDPADGLLTQGADGYQLTWMDAKVGDWVVTPRRGKAVEINALWYNALRLMQTWLNDEGQPEASRTLAAHADRAYDSFNKRFWYKERGWLYDVVDTEGPDDPSLRPNQLFAIALPHPVLHPDRWRPVLDTVTERLLTPMGLRTLAPGDPNYKPRYDGDLRARDAAYHQGTVWAWLVGPFIDAWQKVYPDKLQTPCDLLASFPTHQSEACVGSISEIFDAEAPYTPRGCIAQAWSVAEVLRCWVNTMPQAVN
jgi:predicted glycogen debranching enzyme